MGEGLLSSAVRVAHAKPPLWGTAYICGNPLLELRANSEAGELQSQLRTWVYVTSPLWCSSHLEHALTVEMLML